MTISATAIFLSLPNNCRFVCPTGDFIKSDFKSLYVFLAIVIFVFFTIIIIFVLISQCGVIFRNGEVVYISLNG